MITEDQFIRKVEAKKKAWERKKKEQEGRKRKREEKHILRKAQKEAWEEVCRRYTIEKAEHERCYHQLREGGIRVRDLPPKPKRCLQKDVFNKVREEWVRDLEIDEDRMEVNKSGVSSVFDDDDLVEVSPFHQKDGEGGLGLDSDGEDKEDEEDEGGDLMDVDKL